MKKSEKSLCTEESQGRELTEIRNQMQLCLGQVSKGSGKVKVKSNA